MNKIMEAVREWIKEIVKEVMEGENQPTQASFNDHEDRIAEIEKRLDNAEVRIEI